MEHVERVLDLDNKGEAPFSVLTMEAPSGDPTRPFKYSIEVSTQLIGSLTFGGRFQEFWEGAEKAVLEDIEKNPLEIKKD